MVYIAAANSCPVDVHENIMFRFEYRDGAIFIRNFVGSGEYER